MGGDLGAGAVIERQDLARLPPARRRAADPRDLPNGAPLQVLSVAGALIVIQPTCQPAPSSSNLAGTSQQIPGLYNTDDPKAGGTGSLNVARMTRPVKKDKET